MNVLRQLLRLRRRIVSIGGPLELVDGKLLLRIPLSVGGEQLRDSAKSISCVENGFLIVEVQPWLAEKLRVGPGSLVIVDNADGRFSITRSPKND